MEDGSKGQLTNSERFPILRSKTCQGLESISAKKRRVPSVRKFGKCQGERTFENR